MNIEQLKRISKWTVEEFLILLVDEKNYKAIKALSDVDEPRNYESVVERLKKSKACEVLSTPFYDARLETLKKSYENFFSEYGESFSNDIFSDLSELYNFLEISLERGDLGEIKKTSNDIFEWIVEKERLFNWMKEKKKFILPLRNFPPEKNDFLPKISNTIPENLPFKKKKVINFARKKWYENPKINIANMIKMIRSFFEDPLPNEQNLRNWIKKYCPDNSPGRPTTKKTPQ